MAEAGADGNMNMAIGALVALFCIFGGIIFAVMKMTGDDDNPEPKNKGPKKARSALDRMKKGAAGAGADDEDDDEDDRSGRRNAAKDQKKQEKKDGNDAAKQARMQREEQRQEKGGKYKEKLAAREAERLAREQEEEKAQAEQETKDNNEFDQWKEMFAVDGEGQDDPDDDGNRESVIENFIDYIKKAKIVSLEDLGKEFNLRTKRVIARIEELEKLGRISGIFDDRGKFLYISPDEFKEAAAWLQKKGRIGRKELVTAFNDIIDLDGEKAKKKAEAIDFGGGIDFGSGDAGGIDFGSGDAGGIDFGGIDFGSVDIDCVESTDMGAVELDL